MEKKMSMLEMSHMLSDQTKEMQDFLQNKLDELLKEKLKSDMTKSFLCSDPLPSGVTLKGVEN